MTATPRRTDPSHPSAPPSCRRLAASSPLRRLALLAAAVFALGACSDEPTGGAPRPGEMRATLVSPNGPEGSAVLELTGGTIQDVAAAEAFVRVYWVSGTPARFVVLRLEPGEIAFRLLTADVNDPPELRVVEVGGPDDALRSDLSGYSVAVTLGGGS